jgi:putative ABC transport system substrate-binding protein
MTYGPDEGVIFRRAAYYVDRILKGTKPADLPVEWPIKFELVLNLKTAKALGLTIPPSLLFQADEVMHIGKYLSSLGKLDDIVTPEKGFETQL